MGVEPNGAMGGAGSQEAGKGRHKKFASPTAGVLAAGMIKLCIFVGTMLGGYAGWWAGEAVGLGFGWAFVLSGAGSMVGVYAGWRVARKFAE
jgi:hypothetical protein